MRPAWSVRAAIVGALLLAGASAAQAPDTADYERITSLQRREFDAWLADQVSRSAGNLETARYHFVVALSTGHYGTDPVHAIAMRRLAFSLLNNICAAGDRVTPAAWELELWDRGEPIDLTDDPRARARFVDRTPYAPAAGSRGGHDTERAIFEILQDVVKPDEAPSTIVLLLTNTNQSQGPTGAHVSLFGANNPRLAAVIRARGYRAPVRHGFGAMAGQRKLNVDVTGLFPKKLRPLPGAPETPRYPTFSLESWQPPADRPDAADLPRPALAPAVAPPSESVGPEPSTPGSGFPWAILLGVLAVAGIAAAFLLRRKPAQPPQSAAAPSAGKPLPGALDVVLGAAPDERRIALTGLTTATRRRLVARDDGGLDLVDPDDREQQEAGAGVPALAEAGFEERGRLALDAREDTVFLDIRGTETAKCGPRRLILAPGQRLVCRVGRSAAGQSPVRMELVYRKDA